MIVENIESGGFMAAIRGMRNSWNSWEKSDSSPLAIGPKDRELMENLIKAGPSHSKFRRLITAWFDVIGPLYWWKQFDTYKVGTTACSTSSMHTVMQRKLNIQDFSYEKINNVDLMMIIEFINRLIDEYNNETNQKLRRQYFEEVVALLPESFNQKRTICTNYEVLANIYAQRKGHRLKEWGYFRKCLLNAFPESWIITSGMDEADELDDYAEV